MSELQEIPIWAFFLIFLGLFAQSTFLFIHSRRNGHLRWFWGIWGMLNLPTPLIVYVLYITFIIPYRERRLTNDD
ncbi:transcriptional regulator [Salicibibacter cibi]|uniref:Transcriptional regulator n=1 Tax=Salicibibacter cibi TaxID=2743001 RepID=A0A7T7CGR3_9BACI|nr:transcriptional regulator [Salicibibacter cibi]QQK81483.1 transcriptional regulator [Salicibibacter cibi]